jgi:sugar O-acyltransferase (sialic acid O-acetyltransferase NeuD family)
MSQIRYTSRALIFLAVPRIFMTRNNILMKKIILIGGGGHCKSCMDVIENEKKYKIVGIVDKKNKNFSLLNYSVFPESYLDKKLVKNNHAFITVGQIKNYKIRVELFNKLRNLGFKIPFIVSPLAYISKHAIIGQGTIVMHGAIINAGAVIGNNCIINTNSLIEHDVKIGDHTHISTEATINGGVLIGDKVFIGSRSVIKNNITIGDCSIVGAHQYVKKNLNKNSLKK